MKKIHKKLLLFLIVVLTSVSVVSGYSTYTSLFSIGKAVLILVSLESLRLVLIWFIINSVWLQKLILIPVYFFVVVCCSLASMTSLYSEAAGGIDAELSRRVTIIKTKYAEKFEADLLLLDGKINACRVNLAKSPESDYWNKRLIQRSEQRKKIIEDRNRLLEERPEEKEIWIDKHAAILGVKFESMPGQLKRSYETAWALSQLLGYGIDFPTARRGMAFILVITIEGNIILLSLMLKKRVGPGLNQNRIIKELEKDFTESELNRFREKCHSSLDKKKRLPYTSELGKNQRNIRRKLNKSRIDERDFIGMIGDPDV